MAEELVTYAKSQRWCDDDMCNNINDTRYTLNLFIHCKNLCPEKNRDKLNEVSTLN